MSTEEKCPKCEAPGFVLCYDEVDIGVGTLTCISGGDCEHCGQLSLCKNCGVWEWEKHREGCDA